MYSALPPAALLDVVRNSNTKMTTNNANLLAPEFPKVDILDFYGSVVQGDFAKDVEVDAKLTESTAKLFGATTTKSDSSGRVFFNGLGLQGTPGSGPHEMHFASFLNGNIRRFLNSTTYLPTWIMECGLIA